MMPMRLVIPEKSGYLSFEILNNLHSQTHGSTEAFSENSNTGRPYGIPTRQHTRCCRLDGESLQVHKYVEEQHVSRELCYLQLNLRSC